MTCFYWYSHQFGLCWKGSSGLSWGPKPPVFFHSHLVESGLLISIALVIWPFRSQPGPQNEYPVVLWLPFGSQPGLPDEYPVVFWLSPSVWQTYETWHELEPLLGRRQSFYWWGCRSGWFFWLRPHLEYNDAVYWCVWFVCRRLGYVEPWLSPLRGIPW